jgi:hypothetical protein
VRILKSGEVKYKASAYKEANRLNAPPQPMKQYRVGDKVKVYLGHGWGSGYVRFSNSSTCMVYLIKEQRVTCCTDNRNIIQE